MSTLTLPKGLLTHEERAARDRLRLSQYFVVRIAGNAGYDVLRCSRCNSRHPYLTLFCQVQPFAGIEDGLHGFFKATGEAELFMNPKERVQFERVARVFRRATGQGDLRTAHPDTYRSLGIADRDLDMLSVSLGIVEPVSKQVARRLADRINAAGCKPKFTLKGLEGS
jgi:hypothetical protein